MSRNKRNLIDKIIIKEPELLKDLYSEKMCVKDISDKYKYTGINYNQIWSYCRKHSINIQKRRRFFNEDFFFKWTPELCYILGWIISDGYVRRDNGVDIRLNVIDKEILEHIKTHISLTKPVTISKNNNNNRTITAGILFFSKKVCDLLKTYGIVPNKTYITKWVDVIPEEYESHFIRGIFDGDGSVFISKNKIHFSICGTHDLLKQIQIRLNKYTKFKGGFHKGHGKEVWELVISSKLDVESIFYYMYQGSDQTTRLRRKYDKFTNWFGIDKDIDFILT